VIHAEDCIRLKMVWLAGCRLQEGQQGIQYLFMKNFSFHFVPNQPVFSYFVPKAVGSMCTLDSEKLQVLHLC
jgi:hypothetical protein